MAAVSGSVYVSYGQFHLMGEEYVDTDEWQPRQGNGLIQALEEPGVFAVPGQFAIVLTGINSGHINLVMDILESPPESIDLAEWEDVVEVSLHVEEDDAFGIGTVEDFTGDEEFPTFPLVTSGCVRMLAADGLRRTRSVAAKRFGLNF